jgi:hypothetical protein
MNHEASIGDKRRVCRSGTEISANLVWAIAFCSQDLRLTREVRRRRNTAAALCALIRRLKSKEKERDYVRSDGGAVNM